MYLSSVVLSACIVVAAFTVSWGMRIRHLTEESSVGVDGGPRHTNPWTVNPIRVHKDFQPFGSPLDKSNFAPFAKSEGNASIRKVMELLASVRSATAADPFPQLTSFYVLSGSDGQWYEFKREAAPPKPNVDRQLIITVQSGQDSLYCLKDIRSRVNCAVNHDKNSKRAETAGSWTILRVPVANASQWKHFPDLSKRFGGSFTEARGSILKNNGDDLGTKYFKMVSMRSPEVVNIFQKQRISKEDRIKYVEAFKKEGTDQTTYPAHVCPGGNGNVDITEGKVLPFPGASSWMLQLKWEKAGKPKETSRILDMEEDWHKEITSINEDPGRVRIYFVGHSSKSRDWFGSRTGRAYDSEKVSSMLVNAGLTQKRPITISFVACNAARVFCPSLARKLSSLGFKQVTLHCRLPEVGRWNGGAFVKKTIIGVKAVHKAVKTKLIFRTDAEDPGIGTVAY